VSDNGGSTAGGGQVDPGLDRDPADAAEAGGLVYVSDDQPGIRRRRCGRGFTYLTVDAETLPHDQRRAEIEALAIPPAWTDVWICPDPRGHLQATGRDDRGRKQYRYHDRWREVRDATKFDRLDAFGEALAEIRERVDHDLRRRTMSRERVVAIAVALLDETLVRVGNEEYVRENGSYGLTTLRPEHVEASSTKVSLAFPGKGGQEREVSVRDRRLARQVHRCEEIAGQCLFTYQHNGTPATLESGDVNDYLRQTTGAAFTAKDFRTWGGTVVAATTLHELGPAVGSGEADANVLVAVDAVAERLGNTRAVARSGYVHPKVPEAYRVEHLDEHFHAARSRRWMARDEVAVLRLLDAAW
jgi:DNA topoisomerase-1